MGNTIEQLEGQVWGEPAHASPLVTKCHALRKKPIDQFTVEHLRIMIGQDVGTEYIVPTALGILEKDPLAEGDIYPGDLLKAVATRSKRYWKEHPELNQRMTALSARALDLLKARHEEDPSLVDEDLVVAIVEYQADAVT